MRGIFDRRSWLRFGLLMTSAISARSHSALAMALSPPRMAFKEVEVVTFSSLKTRYVCALPTPGDAVAVAWSPDGVSIVAASNCGEVISVWENGTTLLRRIQRTGDGPTLGGSIAFLHGSDRVVFLPPHNAPPEMALCVWDVASGKITQNIPTSLLSPYYRNSADYFQVSQDQTILLAGMRLDSDTAVVYRTRDWQVLATYKNLHGIFSLSLFGGARFAAFGSIKGKVEVFDIKLGRRISVLQSYPPSKFGEFIVGSVAGSPDGAFILTGLGLGTLEGAYANSPEATKWMSDVGSVKIFRISNNELVASLPEPKVPIRRAVWDPTGNYVAILDSSGQVYLWMPFSSPPTYTKFRATDDAFTLAISPNGKSLVVTGDDAVHIFSVNCI